MKRGESVDSESVDSEIEQQALLTIAIQHCQKSVAIEQAIARETIHPG